MADKNIVLIDSYTFCPRQLWEMVQDCVSVPLIIIDDLEPMMNSSVLYDFGGTEYKDVMSYLKLLKENFGCALVAGYDFNFPFDRCGFNDKNPMLLHGGKSLLRDTDCMCTMNVPPHYEEDKGYKPVDFIVHKNSLNLRKTILYRLSSDGKKIRNIDEGDFVFHRRFSA